jgi:monofunctional biosynthetic peptidoglycan transglycosylase
MSSRRRILRRGCLAALLVPAGLVTGWLAVKVATWPDPGALADRNPETTAFIQRWAAADDGGSDRSTELRWTPYDRISPHVVRAVLVAEDIDFFSHTGFATEEIKAALREAAEGGPLRGASTLTQQLAKNLWLAPSRTPWRKLEEAILTVQLERNLSKRRILELYLNVVEFGPGVWGIGNASRTYFDVPPSELSELQAAELAAGLPRPRTWHPGVDSPGYQRRVARIMGRMERADWLWKVIR